MTASLRNTSRVFLWKVLRQKKFHWVKNLLFTLLPVILTTAVFIIVPPDVPRNRDGQFADIINEMDLVDDYSPSDYHRIVYTPNNTFTYNLMQTARMYLHVPDERLEGFHSERDLGEIIETVSQFFIVVFHIDGKQTEPPLNLSYTIRTKNNNFHTHKIYSGDVFEANRKTADEYLRSGFLTLQNTIDKIHIAMLAAKESKDVDSLYVLNVKRFPVPNKAPDRPSLISEFNLIILITYAFIIVALVIQPIVEEKEFGFKEHVKCATRFSALNNISFFFVNYAQLVLTFFVCFIISLDIGTWSCFNVGYPVLLVVLFVFALMCYAFFISTFFDSVLFANCGAPLLLIVPTILFVHIQNQFKVIEIALPLNVFLLGNDILDGFKMAGHCFTTSSVTHKGYPGHNLYSMADIYLALLVDGILYLFLHFYISNVFPGKYGTPRSVFFLLQKSYWCPNKVDCADVGSVINVHGRVYEKCDAAEAIVKVRNLSKVFRGYGGRKKTAVNDLSIDIHKNQITALLGHNGAGKTTAMCMLTGMISKTSGVICVDGVLDINYYRSKIGFCPQHNIFLPYLTCKEHLLFFAQLRGLTEEKAAQEATLILSKINLSHKSNNVAKTLSGGMMRKLCLGNAIIGQTKLLVLDEPSSGLDPESRRDIWNVLLKLKKDHTILITTHFMEEADVLGDKIAILEEGRLIAFGTAMFLKRHYGTGYTLKMLKEPNFRKVDVVDTITKEIPKAEFKQLVEPTFCATLPYRDQDKYVSVLSTLERKKHEFGIESLSITNTTMEEVFLNSASEKQPPADKDETDSSYVLIEDPARKPKKYRHVFFQQFCAIVYKKCLYFRRRWGRFFILVLIPLILASLPFIIFKKKPDSEVEHYDIFKLSPQSIPDPVVMLCLSHPVLRTSEQIDRLLRAEMTEAAGEVITMGHQNCEDFLLQEADKNLPLYYDRLIGALNVEINEFTNKLNVTVMWSPTLLHSSAITLRLANDVLVKTFANENHTIETTNAPLSREGATPDFQLPQYYSELVPIGLMMYMAMYLPLPLQESVFEVKKLLNVSPVLYWVSFFIVDAFVHTLVSGMLIGFTAAWDSGNVFSGADIQFLFLLYIFYGYAYLTLIYAISQVFQSLSSATSVLMYLVMISMIGVGVFSGSMENMERYSVYATVMHILPDFALKHSMKVIYEISKCEQLLKFPELHKSYNKIALLKAIRDLNVTKFFLFMPIFALLLFLILIFVLEDIYVRHKLVKCFLRCKDCLLYRSYVRDEYVEPDSARDKNVLLEKRLVEGIIKDKHMDQYPMVVSQLEKNYFHLKAVRGIDFVVKRGECFGLLGMNGAGKTTTFKMLTLNDTISKGQIFLNGYSCYANEFQYKYQFGYCPQTDALNPFMTGYETLKFYAWVRGMPKHRIHTEVCKWLKKVDIEKYANTMVEFYSGGTKRKLNTAIAMIGDPSVIFLDEPTTGVDPKSRRFVWSCIKRFQTRDKTIVLTSHSMDECETLCNRLAIMAKGNFKCIGPIQKLKSQYGAGFSLVLKLRGAAVKTPAAPEAVVMEMSQVDGRQTAAPRRGRIETDSAHIGGAGDAPKAAVSVEVPAKKTSTVVTDLKLKVSQLFRCELKDEHEGMLQYFIYDNNISWAEVFTKLTRFSAENQQMVENFSINETTLEDIFLQFRGTTDNVQTTEL